jgi:Histidine kinase-, DNA gyrase B-, and HSP90-like ATPase
LERDLAKVTKKTVLTTIDGTPKKRLFLSIISDYDLKTGLCELVDNAFDFWVSTGMKAKLLINVTLDTDRQLIQVRDNAGGVSKDQAELLITPGASRDDTGHKLIGIFGVGGKRAGVALGELVEIRTRFNNGKSIQIDLTKDWIESPSWDLDIYEVPEVDPGTTTVDITKVRQGFDKEEVERIRQHFGATYSWFLEQGCVIELNGASILPITFDAWAYPPDYLPRQAKFTIEPTDGKFLDVTLSGGLILDRDPESENYGVYVYCNHRLIVKELKVRDVGYFVSAEAGVPHPDASLCRVIVEFSGPAELMPWNSSKSGINFSHPAFAQIRRRVIDFTSYYTGLSRRLKQRWDSEVFNHNAGKIETIDPVEALSNKKKVFPKLPSTRIPSHIEVLKERNAKLLRDKPWTLGLIETMGLVDLIGRQKYETKNRTALILLDSNFEIALKEFIVHRADLFPPHTYTNVKLATMFARRTEVVKEVQTRVSLPKTLLSKVNHYYDLRNNLIHQRASMLITDEQVEDYRRVIERVLKKLFDIKFPAE